MLPPAPDLEVLAIKEKAYVDLWGERELISRKWFSCGKKSLELKNMLWRTWQRQSFHQYRATYLPLRGKEEASEGKGD